LSSDPVERQLPSGDALTSYEVTVRAVDQPTESVPVVLLGGKAPKLVKGDAVVVVGRVRRRFFRAGGATASMIEVLAGSIIPVRQRVRVAKALAGDRAMLEEGASSHAE
jgi:single-strand DNA-binding protein